MNERLYLQPKFVFLQQLLLNGLIPVVTFAIPIVAVGIAAAGIKNLLFILILPGLVFLIAIVFLMFKLPLVAKTYKSTHYDFGPSNLSYVESFLNAEERLCE